jgi:hypothetical protein
MLPEDDGADDQHPIAGKRITNGDCGYPAEPVRRAGSVSRHREARRRDACTASPISLARRRRKNYGLR